jgi:hypothetical protein
MTSTASLADEIQFKHSLGVAICQRLTEEIIKLGFRVAEIQHYPRYDDASFELVKDPYTGLHNLTGYWYDDKKQRIGRLQFNSDGAFYAEYDVIKTHPGKSKWFVEGVTAWGKADNIRAEVKLLQIPSD